MSQSKTDLMREASTATGDYLDGLETVLNRALAAVLSMRTSADGNDARMPKLLDGRARARIPNPSLRSS